MTYVKKSLGWLIWWDPLPAIKVSKLRDACAKCEVTLSITLPDALSKGLLMAAIRMVFPNHDVVQVGNGPRYRRFQISRRVTHRSACYWETVDFVRAYNNGRVICETRRDAEIHLINLLKNNTKKVSAATVNKVFRQYIESTVDAVPIGSAYLLPKRPSKTISKFYTYLQTPETRRNMLYVIPLGRNKESVHSVMMGVTRYLCGELHVADKLAKSGSTAAAVREKHRIKRLAQRIEKALETPLYRFRSVLVQTVTDNPAMQDTDEWRSRW